MKNAFIALLIAATTMAGCVQTTTKSLTAKTTTGEVIGDCGDININRVAGVAHPGVVLITKSGTPKTTVPLNQLSKADQKLVRACNSGSHEIIFANSHQPILSVGVGASYNAGGGTSNVYGSTAAAVANQQTVANAGGYASSK